MTIKLQNLAHTTSTPVSLRTAGQGRVDAEQSMVTLKEYTPHVQTIQAEAQLHTIVNRWFDIPCPGTWAATRAEHIRQPALRLANLLAASGQNSDVYLKVEGDTLRLWVVVPELTEPALSAVAGAACEVRGQHLHPELDYIVAVQDDALVESLELGGFTLVTGRQL